MEEKDKYNTPTLHLFLIKNLLKLLTGLLDNHKIRYFVDGGTLLGCMREKDIIAHDDDADIGIINSDFNKLDAVFDEIMKTKITINNIDYPVLVVKDPYLTKVYIPNLWCTTEAGRIIATPTVDIFNWTCKNNMIKLSSLRQRIQFKNCYYKKSEMFPLKKYMFGDFEVYGARDGLPYLHRYYGSDCMNVAKIEIRQPSNESILNKSTDHIEFLI